MAKYKHEVWYKDFKRYHDARLDFVGEIIYRLFPCSYVDSRRIWAAVKRAAAKSNKKIRDDMRRAAQYKREAAAKKKAGA